MNEAFLGQDCFFGLWEPGNGLVSYYPCSLFSNIFRMEENLLMSCIHKSNLHLHLSILFETRIMPGLRHVQIPSSKYLQTRTSTSRYMLKPTKTRSTPRDILIKDLKVCISCCLPSCRFFSHSDLRTWALGLVNAVRCAELA